MFAAKLCLFANSIEFEMVPLLCCNLASEFKLTCNLNLF